MDQVRQYTSKAEDVLATLFQPLKPYIPAIARFLIVVTFLEDALRIFFQWEDQLHYLERIRGFPWGASHIFLAGNIIDLSSLSGENIQNMQLGVFSLLSSPNLLDTAFGMKSIFC
ncbi:12057_t:CDS:2 [Acaulospora colombiana]|uniref:12057_t:CDS:1 n=1 Tax=Acaulospora colombiana TaxID=27376 RepID=A0ACA9MYC4_9GLOM|nr:12057_t:CDS:2 [Acaulospora colombiana]